MCLGIARVIFMAIALESARARGVGLRANIRNRLGEGSGRVSLGLAILSAILFGLCLQVEHHSPCSVIIYLNAILVMARVFCFS